jgi:hypothetical protein
MAGAGTDTEQDFLSGLRGGYPHEIPGAFEVQENVSKK